MKLLVCLSALGLALSVAAAVAAQPPAEPDPNPEVPLDQSQPPLDGPGPLDDGGPPERRPFGPPPNPLMQALDKDKDGTLSAEEINGAKEALLTLDKDADGKLAGEEVRPRRPRPPAGFESKGREDREGRRPGLGDRGPGGRGRPGDRSKGRPDGPPEGRGPEGRGPEGGDRECFGRQERGDRDGGPPQGPPNPERLVEEALSFDSDGDEKLDRDELLQFAEEMGRRRGHGPEGGGPDADGPPEGRRRRGEDLRPDEDNDDK